MIVNKFGTAAAVEANRTLIWTGHSAGAAGVMRTTHGPLLTFKSTDAADTAGGTGARSIMATVISLVDGVYRLADIFATMNGAGAATIEPAEEAFDRTAALRVLRMRLVDSGSGNTNVGRVTALIDGVVCCEMPAGIGTSEIALFSIGGDQNGKILNWHAAILDTGVGQAAHAVIKLWEHSFAGSSRVVAPPGLLNDNNAVIHYHFDGGLELKQNTDYYLEIFSIITGPADFSGAFQIELSQRLSEAFVAP